jgi:hypothetical protein
VAVALLRFSVEDRQRMRAERTGQREWLQRELLFLEFLREQHPEGEATRPAETQGFIDKIGRLDIRPCPTDQTRPGGVNPA